MNALQLDRKVSELCLRCGRESPDANICQRCAPRQHRWQRNSMAARRARIRELGLTAEQVVGIPTTLLHTLARTPEIDDPIIAGPRDQVSVVETAPTSRSIAMQPSIGRIVHFIDHEGAPRAAIVTHVFSPACVNLAWWGQSGDPHNATSVSFNEDRSTRYTWSWPPKV